MKLLKVNGEVQISYKDVNNLDECDISSRNGTYGGDAGSKEGILINGEYWIVKYPQNTKSLQNVDIDYTTSPLSEYLGSHIYEMLGYDTHKTVLGYRNDKIVVACKDFRLPGDELLEMRTLKNVYNSQLNEELDKTFSSTSSSHRIELDQVLTHLNYNPIMSTVPGLKERFWDMAVIDIFLGNSDRNNGNWGLLFHDNSYKISPVYDNGASFDNRKSDEKMSRIMQNRKNFIGLTKTKQTIFSQDGHTLNSQKFLSLDNDDLRKSLSKNVPLISRNINDILQFVDGIPETYKGLEVMSPTRKEYYKSTLEIRLHHTLEPAYDRQIVKYVDKSRNSHDLSI